MTVEHVIHTFCEGLNKIQQGYINLKTTYEPGGIVRERVFCYELYHQLRLILADNNEVVLNGEIDKRGHLHFDQEDRKNPDFVFHIPGYNFSNLAVCEVKGNINDGIVKDFNTLTTFVSKYDYQTGFFILFNHTRKQLFDELPELKKVFKNVKGADKIYILTLPSEGKLEVPDLLSKD